MRHVAYISFVAACAVLFAVALVPGLEGYSDAVRYSGATLALAVFLALVFEDLA